MLVSVKFQVFILFDYCPILTNDYCQYRNVEETGSSTLRFFVKRKKGYIVCTDGKLKTFYLTNDDELDLEELKSN